MIKKILSVVLAAVMLCVALVVPASAASLEELSIQIKSDVKKSVDMNGDDWGSPSVYYKIVVSEDGDLDITYSTNIRECAFMLYNEIGNVIAPQYCEAYIGKVESGLFSPNFYSINAEYIKAFEVDWNSKVEKAEGLVRFTVKKGTYYLRIAAEEGNGKMTFTPKFPSDDTPATKSIQLKITMKVGETIRLGAIVSPDGAEKVKWSTTKKSVASVSSKGKVTAKGEGTATIKAKSGSKVLKIKIIVEE